MRAKRILPAVLEAYDFEGLFGTGYVCGTGAIDMELHGYGDMKPSKKDSIQ